MEPLNKLDEMKRLYEDEHFTLQRIAKRFGVSLQAIHKRLTRAGVKMRPTAVVPVLFDQETLNQLYNVDGLTLDQVGAKLGVSATKIAQELRRSGIQVRRPGVEPSEPSDHDLLYELYVVKGLSCGAVGTILGVSPKTVFDRLKSNGISRRKTGPKPRIRDLSEARELTEKTTEDAESQTLEQIKGEI